MQNKESVDFSLLAARSESDLRELAQKMPGKSQVFPFDFAKAESLSLLLDEVAARKIKRVFYFAAGGPYGLFASKEWKDHMWSLQVSFLTPSEILHRILTRDDLSCVEQIIFVGSLIADDKPDPMAASYASAKHGLKGLVESVQSENSQRDIRFFRPGYMNTGLLPKNAKPRGSGQVLLDPIKVAKQFVDWALDDKGLKILDISN